MIHTNLGRRFGRCRQRRYVDALTVGDARGEVEPANVRIGGEPSGLVNEVRQSLTPLQRIDARLLDGSGDVCHRRGGCRRWRVHQEDV